MSFKSPLKSLAAYSGIPYFASIKKLFIPMKNAFLLIIASLWFPSVFGQQNDAALKAGFDKLLSEEFKPGQPGATALVARKGQIIYQKALGMANLEFNIPMQVDNIFRIGSVKDETGKVSKLILNQATFCAGVPLNFSS
jgi:hypothetical protein